MASSTTPRPSALIRTGAARFPLAGHIYSGTHERSPYGGVNRISALGALYAGAGYDLDHFNRGLANETLFNGYRAWVSGIGRELPIVEAIEDLMSHEKWSPEDVARYLEKNLGL